MRKLRLLSTIVVGAMAVVATAQTHQFNIQANKLGAPVQPTMYGIFFEDINFGADGGLYAEMVENRSFEFPSHLMGWGTFGNVSVSDVKPAFERNPHYVTLLSAGHDQKFSGLENKGFFGMGVKKGMKYDFSVYARLNSLQGKAAKIRVEIVDSKDNPIDQDTITITNNQWKKFTASLWCGSSSPPKMQGPAHRRAPGWRQRSGRAGRCRPWRAPLQQPTGQCFAARSAQPWRG